MRIYYYIGHVSIQVYVLHNELPHEEISKMIESSNSYPDLVWTVNALRSDGKTEVIRVCKNCCDADEAIQNEPTKYYKSGPIPLS